MKHKILSSDYYTCNEVNGVAEINIKDLPVLYKYQKVSEHSLTNLGNGEIWGTCPDAFNDPYDCICCYTVSQIKKAVYDLLSEERICKYKAIFQTNSRAKVVEELILSLLSKYNENFRKQYCVSCFSIYNDSEIMWGHYADCAKGFVTAYNGYDLQNCALTSNRSIINIMKSINLFGLDLSKLPEDTHSTIMPVIYSNGKVNITTNIISNIPFLLEYYDDLCNELTINRAVNNYIQKIQESFYAELQPNNDIFYSIMCNKNKCWQYEQEWRIWSYNSNVFTGNILSPYVKIGNVAAKAIYLGEHISPYNKRILIDIANNQNIPIYQMKTKMYKNRCALVPYSFDK